MQSIRILLAIFFSVNLAYSDDALAADPSDIIRVQPIHQIQRPVEDAKLRSGVGLGFTFGQANLSGGDYYYDQSGLAFYLFGNIALWDRIQLGATLPVLVQGIEGGGQMGDTEQMHFGNVRLSVKIRLMTVRGFTLSAMHASVLPTTTFDPPDGFRVPPNELARDFYTTTNTVIGTWTLKQFILSAQIGTAVLVDNKKWGVALLADAYAGYQLNRWFALQIGLQHSVALSEIDRNALGAAIVPAVQFFVWKQSYITIGGHFVPTEINVSFDRRTLRAGNMAYAVTSQVGYEF